jgi:ABC-2 type transport system permease protein
LRAPSTRRPSGFTFGITFLPYVEQCLRAPEIMPAVLRGFAENQPITPVVEAALAGCCWEH